jgi:HD superfamily phosphohydrolase
MTAMGKRADITKRLIKDFTQDEIQLTGHLDQGRDGLVFRGYYKANTVEAVAVKFYVSASEPNMFSRNTTLPVLANDWEHRFNNEREHLLSFRHPNLQQYLSHGQLNYESAYFAPFGVHLKAGSRVPFIVSRLIEGVRLDRLMATNTVKRRDLFLILTGIADGLSHLHRRHILHADVRPENVIIDSASSAPVLLDFGLSKQFTSPQDGYTPLIIDPNLLPTDIYQLLSGLEKQNTINRNDLEKILFPWADLFFFGKLISRLLDDSHNISAEATDIRFLRLLVQEMSKWHVSPGGATEMTTMSGVIQSAAEAQARLRRLELGEHYYDYQSALSEANPPRIVVRARATLSIRESVAPIIDTPGLRRLHNLNQLSLVRYIFPSAGQSRFDHVLSVLGMVQRFRAALAKCPEFLFYVGSEDASRLELAALLHDINHIPFLHYFQEAGIREVQGVPIIELLLGFDPSLSEHLERAGLSTQYLRRLITDEPIDGASPADQVIRSILNSGIDADKLAYLGDDAFFTGVPFGNGIDLQGLLSNVEIAVVEVHEQKRKYNTWHIVFGQDALPAVESACFARYWNFQRVYWHHVNRALASMIIWTIRSLMTNGMSLEVYLRDTRDSGEAGALEYLARAYEERFEKRVAPIAALASDRRRVYKRVFEMSFERATSLLSAMQDEQTGAERRLRAEESVLRLVSRFATERGYRREIRTGEVLLDIPLRNMDLGGGIYIRRFDGQIVSAVTVSKLLSSLQEDFASMSKVLRVFVSPAIRNDVGLSAWEDPKFKDDVLDAIESAIWGEKRTKTEVK